MELPENDDGYEVDDSGEYVSGSKDSLGLTALSSSQLENPASREKSGDASNSRRVVIHRSGSVTVMNAGDVPNVSAILHRSETLQNTNNVSYSTKNLAGNGDEVRD